MHDGRQKLAEGDLLPAITPQIVSARGHRAEARSGHYGYGFNVGVTPSGRTVLSHSGAFLDGASTHVQMIPAMDLGIVILTNGGPLGIPEAVATAFMERARTGVLHRSLPGISKKMLVQALREMERSGLIVRHVKGTVPPAVEYSLTSLGHRFVGLVDLVYDWGRRNSDALDQLQERPSSRRKPGDEGLPEAMASSSDR